MQHSTVHNSVPSQICCSSESAAERKTTFFFGVFCYLPAFLLNLWVPKSLDSGTSGPVLSSVAVNLSFILLFGIQHTSEVFSEIGLIAGAVIFDNPFPGEIEVSRAEGPRQRRDHPAGLAAEEVVDEPMNPALRRPRRLLSPRRYRTARSRSRRPRTYCAFRW